VPRAFQATRVFRSVFLLLTVLALVSPLESYLALAQPQSLEFHNPLHYRPASLSSPGTPPFVPSDIRKAYDFLPLYARGINGTGTRIAIIDAYGDPTLSTDLASFDSLTGLPNPTVNLAYPDGVPGKCHLSTCANWALETALDVEWAHAIAPAATIDLVIGLDASLQHLFDGMSYVANTLTTENVVSMSFGLGESSYPTTGSYTIATTHQLFVTMISHGTTVFASSGDAPVSSCCTIIYPASDPLVVAVGGTSLTLNSTANYVNETVWNDQYGSSTAGSSIIFTKPAYQTGFGDNMRDNVDVSYNGDVLTGVLVVQGGVQRQVGGTSAGSPQWAGLVDLASQANGTRLGNVLPRLYNLTSYHDVKTGSDGFFTATKGWDYPTGLGTPDANAIVTSLSSQTANVGLTTILPSRNFAYSQVFANPIMVNVTVANHGSGPATLTLTLEANTTMMGSQNITIAGGATKVATFAMHTDFLSRGNYTLSAQVTLQSGTTNIGNGTMTSPMAFSVRLAGDTDNDCKVNIADLTSVGGAFGSTPSSSAWNPYADLNNDGIINISDLTIVGGNFGNTC
jgi:subtilase family serine protease